MLEIKILECKSKLNPVNCKSHIFSNSDDFQNTLVKGVVCVFSLKNPTWPEYQCWTTSPVSSLDLHAEHPHMVCVGLANGNVLVYNLQKDPSIPCHMSSAEKGKHMGIVWHIK